MNDDTELQGTFACSVCGVAEPHHHDITHINKRRVEEAVLRPRFEQLLHNLMQGGEPFSELRVSGWGHPAYWNKRLDAPSIEFPAQYHDAKAEALWQFFLRTHYAATAGVSPSDQQPKPATDADALDAHRWRVFSQAMEFVWSPESDGTVKWVRWLPMPAPDISKEGLRKASGLEQLEAWLDKQP